MKTLSLVIPCKNESRRLNAPAFLDAAERWPWLSFCFVDDGSTDSTSELLAWLANQSPAMHALYLPENKGKAEAVRAGIMHLCGVSGADLVGFWDADLATSLEEIPRFVESFEGSRNIEAVIGSRWPHLGADIRRSPGRGLAGMLIKSAIRTLLGVPVWDTQCGAKVFTRELAGSIFAKPFKTRWLFDVELLSRLASDTLRKRTLELSVMSWVDVPGSKLGFGETFSILHELALVAMSAERGSALRSTQL